MITRLKGDSCCGTDWLVEKPEIDNTSKIDKQIIDRDNGMKTRRVSNGKVMQEEQMIIYLIVILANDVGNINL